ncbi:diversity-generating retroelement protein Avd [[Phormidium] sp. ETS-05]|uniref:diversity-generating retroelement protein Avd n=1 Tax=[Phormidium] sp. ETS-05 TaxID=222819 RepID=UPI0018EF15A2|nr:diversity-generating retroelement protein Avd [[Phormidium] sp. ETS-05]
MSELPIIQKTYDLVKWYVPILNRLPRNHKFTLGDRMIENLYELLEGMIVARYQREKLTQLEQLNIKLEILRFQTRLMFDFGLVQLDRYEYIFTLINEIGNELGGWIKQQKRQSENNSQKTSDLPSPLPLSIPLPPLKGGIKENKH